MPNRPITPPTVTTIESNNLFNIRKIDFTIYLWCSEINKAFVVPIQNRPWVINSTCVAQYDITQLFLAQDITLLQLILSFSVLTVHPHSHNCLNNIANTISASRNTQNGSENGDGLFIYGDYYLVNILNVASPSCDFLCRSFRSFAVHHYICTSYKR